MKKSILNIGKVLNKEEQKNIAGGGKGEGSVFRCLDTYEQDPRCCSPSECGEVGGMWNPGSSGYGSSENCSCF